MCFAWMRLSYRPRTVALLGPGPRAARIRSFLRCETGGAPLDPDWVEVRRIADDVVPARTTSSRSDAQHIRDSRYGSLRTTEIDGSHWKPLS
jgi:hypothetical protein